MPWIGPRLATRRLLRAPLFTIVTLVTLAVGIGANTAIFSVAYGVLLKPLPFAEPERLVGVWHSAPGMNIPLLNLGPSNYFTYRDEGRAFEDIGIFRNESVTVTGGEQPERLQALRVTHRLLPLLRVAPAIGRTFSPGDDEPGAPTRVLLTYGYWQRRYGGLPVVGRSIVVDGNPLEIVGVLPESFAFPGQRPALLTPLQFNRADVPVGNFAYRGIARLRPGVTLEQANADVARLLPRIPDRFPLPPGFSRTMYDELRLGPRVRPLREDVVGDVGRVLWILLGTVGAVLLIACANVANLSLVRAEGRQQEFAVRAALGASRAQMARSMLSESIALGLCGGALGVLLAQAGLGLLVRLAPSGLPRLEEIEINGVVLLFTLGVSVLAGVLFGIIPVVRFGQPGVTALKEGGRSAGDGPSRHRARNALVVAEISLALVLLVLSGLMLRSFQALRAVDPGFRSPQEVQTFRIAVPGAVAATADGTVRLYQRIKERLAAVPGVTSVGVTSSLTMDGYDSWDPLFVEGVSVEGGPMPPVRRYKWLGEGYVETMGNRLVAGRLLTWDDALRRRPVAMISDNLARELYGSPAAAIGRRVRNAPSNPWREIVGVVGDDRDDGLSQPAPTTVYWPMALKEFWADPEYVARNMAFVVRSSRVSSPGFLRELQQAVWSINANLPVANPETLAEVLAASMGRTTFALTMLAVAAGVALLLGVVGIYGVVAYVAAQRTREIGVRMALGAQAADVRRLLVARGLKLVAAGVAIGIAAALLLTRLMATLLFGVGPADPLTYACVSLMLGAVALAATYLPARRASRVDPIIALRADA
jgi:predicted permease